VCAVGLNWHVFGSSGCADRNDRMQHGSGLNMRALLRHAPRCYGPHQHVKCIMWPERVSRFTSMHYAVLLPGFVQVGATGAPFLIRPLLPVRPDRDVA